MTLEASHPPKLVLTVIDGMKPTMLERAIKAGTAPALQAIRDRGTYVDDCVAAFPSVTPVCASVIATGRMQDEHGVPSMNWYSREEERYVEYGSSFSASRKFGLNRQLVDTIFNMNSQHLSPDVHTVFETLDDAGVRTACTSYLIFRGRHEHEVSRDFALTRVASQLFKRSVMGPAELFYADIFASRKTGCWSRMGIRGCATSMRAASARTSSSTTSSTSCCCRCPTTTRTRTRTGRTRRSRRSRRPTPSCGASWRPAAAPSGSSTSTR